MFKPAKTLYNNRMVKSYSKRKGIAEQKKMLGGKSASLIV
jgi:hypothetical protein